MFMISIFTSNFRHITVIGNVLSASWYELERFEFFPNDLQISIKMFDISLTLFNRRNFLKKVRQAKMISFLKIYSINLPKDV